MDTSELTDQSATSPAAAQDLTIDPAGTFLASLLVIAGMATLAAVTLILVA
jgi:hypothetical protein